MQPVWAKRFFVNRDDLKGLDSRTRVAWDVRERKFIAYPQGTKANKIVLDMGDVRTERVLILDIYADEKDELDAIVVTENNLIDRVLAEWLIVETPEQP